MSDALPSQVDNEAHDRGGIGNAIDIAGRDNPQEDKSLQSLEMDNEAHDNVGANGGTDKPLEEKSNIESSIKLDLEYEVELEMEYEVELEMDYETDDNDRANGGTDEPLIKEKRNNEVHDNVGANGGTDEPLEEKSNVAPSIELELDYEVDDEVVIANVGENTVTDIPLKEESCVAPSKELEMDYEGDDNDGANGGKDEPLKETNNNEAHDNVGANRGADKPLEGKRNVAPSIERELYNEVDDEVVIANVEDNTVTDEESCVVPSKELEIDYEADDNDRANEGTDEPLKEKSNNEAHDNVGANGATDKPLEERSNVAPPIELKMDYEADDEVVIDSVRRNAEPVKLIEEESFVTLSKELELDYEVDDDVVMDNVDGKFGTSKPLEEERNVAPSKELELDFEVDNQVITDNEEKVNEICKVEQCPIQPENPSPKELDIDLHNCANSISVKMDNDLDEELEEGEIKDEDESPKKEVTKPRPRPECRFYARGRCTRGDQCRFLHPGVPDLRGFSIFTPTRSAWFPVAETITSFAETEPQLPLPPPEPQRESAWERGLRAAKQMRLLADQRKRVDSEYEEKKSSMSITQIEMDKEHDYNSRPATPMDKEHDYNSRSYYREDHLRTEPYNNNIRSDGYSGGYAHDSYYEQLDHHSQFMDTDKMMRRRSSFPPPIKERHGLAASPPDSKIPHDQRPRHAGHQDDEYPWMGNFETRAGGSTRSSSAGSSISASSRASPFRYSSPESRRSSSRSRSCTPPGATSSNQTQTQSSEGRPAKKCTAPLQKRLAGFASTKRMKSKSKSASGARPGSNSLSQLQQPAHGNSGNHRMDQMSRVIESKVKIESAKSADLTSSNQKDPVKISTSLPKNKIKLTLKAYHATRSPNKTVLEKLDEAEAEIKQPAGDGKKLALKRKLSDKGSSGSTSKKKCYGDQGNQEKELVPVDDISNAIQNEIPKASGNDSEDIMRVNIKTEEKEKKKKKSSTKSRKEELMKQLKAVEDAITKKRDKLVEN